MDREFLKLAAEAVEAKLPDNHGFVLLVVPFGQPEPQVAYIAKANREDAIKMLKTFLFRIGEGENWMNHIN